MKENMVQKFFLSRRRKYIDKKKDITNMRTVINTSTFSLGEEEFKTIEDLKRQIVLMEEENIKLFNVKKKHNSKKIPKSLPK